MTLSFEHGETPDLDEEIARGVERGELCGVELKCGGRCGRTVDRAGLCDWHATEAGVRPDLVKCAVAGCSNSVSRRARTCSRCKQREKRRALPVGVGFFCAKCGRPRRPGNDLCYDCRATCGMPSVPPERRKLRQKAARERWLKANGALVESLSG